MRYVDAIFLEKKGAMRFRLWCDAIAIPVFKNRKFAIFRIFSERSVAVKFRSRIGARVSLKIFGLEPESKINPSPIHSIRLITLQTKKRPKLRAIKLTGKLFHISLGKKLI